MGKKFLVWIGLTSLMFGFSSIEGASTSPSSTSQSYVRGKVIRAYHRPGFGRAQNKWLFMDIKTPSGIVAVGIAPVFKISNLPIKVGDVVDVRGMRPPLWSPNTFKAWDIYDVTQRRDYPIGGRGWRGAMAW